MHLELDTPVGAFTVDLDWIRMGTLDRYSVILDSSQASVVFRYTPFQPGMGDIWVVSWWRFRSPILQAEGLILPLGRWDVILPLPLKKG